ncbi:MAG: hypothetical protein ACK559_18625, partial [bacterium]
LLFGEQRVCLLHFEQQRFSSFAIRTCQSGTNFPRSCRSLCGLPQLEELVAEDSHDYESEQHHFEPTERAC